MNAKGRGLSPSIQVGIDVGGTFTDLVAFDEQTGWTVSLKVHSTPSDPSEGVLEALSQLRAAGREDAKVRKVAHGTTIATNTLIEKNGAKTCLLATNGFEDVLELRRHNRPQMYNLFQEIAPPLVPRHLRVGITERVDPTGLILLSMDEEGILGALEWMEREGVEAAAICFLHAYVNSIHEKRAMEMILERFPHLFVSCSHEVWPEFREYERTSTTVLNAYIGPRVGRYLHKMSEELRRQDVGSFYVMKSNGGLTSAENARRFPVHLIESGPAAGMVAAEWLGRDLGFENVIALDIGGTTAKAGIIAGGTPRVTTDFYAEAVRHGIPIGGYAIKSPVIELVEIGAGGGSIAWVDRAGVLKVGPQSAGAVPGPACYGLGGTEPTITDASLVLGFLNPDYFHGGRTPLHPELAARAIQDKVGSSFGWSVERAAAAIIRIATANMIEMVRLVSIRKGYDPREFCLLAYGGAGPLYAGSIAEDLNIPLILIPPLAGLFSALGVLVADIRHDLVTTSPYLTDEMPPRAGASIFQELERRMMDILDKEHRDLKKVAMHRSVDMRYLGQVFELNIPIHGDLNGHEAIRKLEGQFEEEYREAYHYVLPGSRIEIVNFRLTAAIDGTGFSMEAFSQGLAVAPAPSRPSIRKVYDDKRDEFLEVRVFQGSALGAHQEIEGPAIIEKEDTTIHILDGQRGLLDERGCLRIKADYGERRK